MSNLAKKAREAMKSKARQWAGAKDQKVDSSDWSPAEPINADIKTGMRPVSRRAYKSGGKVEGDSYAKQIVNRNVKEANESRPGIKHVGGMKTGGRAKKNLGGVLEKISPAYSLLRSAQRGGRDEERDAGEQMKGAMMANLANRKSGGGVKDKKALGAIDPSAKRETAGHYKKGGEAKPPQAASRMRRATGGAALDVAGMKKAGKKHASGKGKTNINIVIAAGKGQGMPPADVMAPPAAMPMPMPPPPMAGPPAAAMPPMPPMPPAGAGPMPPMPPVPGRKAGGRITKAASSYKDMEAGAASGEGRLQKTEIARRHKDAPARKSGGRISKVAKSYKDMTAGAASGEGRLQKTDIAKAK